MRTASPVSIIFVCQRGELELQSALLAASLRRQLGDQPELIAAVPQIAGQLHTPLAPALQLLERLNVTVAPFDNSFTRPGERLESTDLLINKAFCMGLPVKSPRTIVTDSDMVCMRPYDFSKPWDAPVCCKPVDHQNERRWKPLYELFDLEVPNQVVMSTQSNEPGPPYFNSGFVSVAADVAGSLSACWLDTFEKITKSGIMGDNLFFREQVSLAIAVHRLETRFGLLEDEFNYPAHSKAVDATNPPFFVHYHQTRVLGAQEVLNRYVTEIAEEHSELRKLGRLYPHWLSELPVLWAQ